jgi:hypothetical protein
MEKKKMWVYGIVALVAILVIVIGTSYAYWRITMIQTGENTINSSCFKLEFEEQENSNITILEGYPISDEDGKKLTPYTFSIKNGCGVKAKYVIRLEIDNSSTLNEQYIKSQFNTGSIKKVNELKNVNPTLTNAKSSYILEEMTINGNETKTFALRLWIDGSVSSSNQEVMNKSFEGKVTIEGSYDGTYTESILNGTDPVLKDGLIPVTIDNDGVVKKADITKEWYSYTNKVWANAVILNDESKSYSNEEVIPEENIESYFVWIPRYRYQIFDNGMYYELSDSLEDKTQEIKVVFESRETQLSKGTKKGDWLTHPAFTSFDVNGIWVGKFETGYKGSTDKTSAESNTIEPNKVQIKPNVNSWRNIQVSNAFYSSYDYKRELDSHMMKNTEWGAVAYLQHSKYGSMSSVRINNNSNFITGYSAVNEPTCGYTGTNEECNRYGVTEDITKLYNTSTGYLASTTGNISGIYDMSGGVYEYVMGVMVDQEGNPISGRNSLYNSGFNGPFGCPTCDNDTSGLTELTAGLAFPNDTRYYDIYTYAENDETYGRRLLGDATGEIGSFVSVKYGSQWRKISTWFKDESKFIWNTAPWFVRGMSFIHGSGAGVFSFNNTSGSFFENVNFRIVLTPGGSL